MVLLGLDFASRGLGALASLAQVVDVATGDDLEAVTRHLAVLFDELQRRRRLLADAHAEHLTAYNERHDPLPRIVLLVDGFGGFMSTFGDTSRGGGGMSSAVPLESWIERLVTIVVDGRQVGIHTVITADRRNAVPARIHAAVGSRLIMRHADENGYNEHGISSTRAKQLDLSPGRGLWDGGATVQIAAVARDPSARGQGDAIADFASLLGSDAPCVLASHALGDDVPVERLGSVPSAPLHVPLGVADITGAPVVVDLTWSNLTVAGPPRSGRSTVLDTAAAVARRAPMRCGRSARRRARSISTSCTTVRSASPTSSRPSSNGSPTCSCSARPDGHDCCSSTTSIGSTIRRCNPLWDQLADHDDFRMIATIENRSMTGYTASGMLNLARRSRRVLILRPDDAGDFLQMTGIKPPIRPGLAMPPGRGVLVADREPTVMQVARRAVG